MIDGRTAHTLARLLAVAEDREGELVLTKDRGRWAVQMIVGAGQVPSTEREVVFGHGTLYEALQHLVGELGLPTTVEEVQREVRRAQITSGQLGPRIPHGRGPSPYGQPAPGAHPYLATPEAPSP